MVCLSHSPGPLLPLAAKREFEMKSDESIGTFIPMPATLFISRRFTSEQRGSRECGKQQMQDPQAGTQLVKNIRGPPQSFP